MKSADVIRKKKEYQAFIKAIDKGQVGHWVEVARALNVNEDTILAWKKLPEAQEAIQKGIDYALQCMQQAGARDWHMWEAKLKMFGINPATKIDATIDDGRMATLAKYGLGEDDAGKASEAKS